MDYSVIDELYNAYLDEFIDEAEDLFELYYKRYQMGGNHDLEETLKQYIKEQTAKLSNAFISNKDDKNKLDLIIRETAAAFEAMLSPVQYFIDDFVYGDTDIEEIKYDGIKSELIKPHDLFNIDMKFIEGALAKYDNCFEEAFNKVKNLITYVKKNKLLDELYSDGSWRKINFEELLANLYDKAADKKVFEVRYEGILIYEDTLFDKIKQNCSQISTLAFDKYRPQLNSSKQIRAEFGKLIFCKNLLSFFETGIMPDSDGFVDFTISEYEAIKMKDEFKHLYSKHFDESYFRKNQLNIICRPEVCTPEINIDVAKKVNFGDRMIMGYIIDAKYNSGNAEYTIKYLIHINIEDVNNPCSNYEIQLNLVPQGKISNRMQLMRLDNWASEQPHKNVAKKLTTRTHIHLYNEFDLLRGKTNGNYDIAYNLDSKSTDFETALKTFLNILGFEERLQRSIYNTTMKCINNSKKEEKSLEI